MTVATPFSALGAGNGFSACLPRVDVDSETDVITLAGYRPGLGTLTPELIEASRAAAMKLYWNLEALKGKSSNDYGTVGVTEFTVTRPTNKPHDRVCFPPSFYEGDNVVGRAFRFDVAFSRFFHGGVFIGIGITPGLGGGAIIEASCSGGGRVRVFLQSCAVSAPLGTPSEDSAFVNIGGIHFLSQAFGTQPSASSPVIVTTLNASTLFAECTVTTGLATYKATADFKTNSGPFEFYSYA